MADWETTLPDSATVGDATHVEDHNAIAAAISEARAVIDAAEATIESLQSLLEGKAATGHEHAAGDVTSGTFAVARIPALAQSKITGLADALGAKADNDALAALEGRVTALETPEE